MKENVVFTLGEIAEAVEGSVVCGDLSSRVGAVTTDSRICTADDLFVPIKGEKHDAHEFIEKLVVSGNTRGFLTQTDLPFLNCGKDFFAVKVSDTLNALGRLASFHRKRMNAEVIGITGTNGKTTTKEIIHSIFSKKYNVIKSEKNYNNEIGLPFTLFSIKENDRYAIVEMGMNHTGEISRLASYALPDSALITNAGEGHLEFLGSVENVAKAKSEIMEPMRENSPVFLNKDSEYYELMSQTAHRRGLREITFGMKNADYSPERHDLKQDSLCFRMNGEDYSAPLYGMHNLYNILAGTALALYYGFDSDEISSALESFSNVGKRSEITECGYTVINDTYNSNPLSLRSALLSIGSVYRDRRKIAVIGDMKELGASGEYYHRKAAEDAVAGGFGHLLCFGDLTRFTCEEAARFNGEIKAEHYESKEDIIAVLTETLREGDVVLIKGSRSMKMEEVADRIIRV